MIREIHDIQYCSWSLSIFHTNVTELAAIVSPVNAGIVAGSTVGVVAVIASLIIFGVILFGIVRYSFCKKNGMQLQH